MTSCEVFNEENALQPKQTIDDGVRMNLKAYGLKDGPMQDFL